MRRSLVLFVILGASLGVAACGPMYGEVDVVAPTPVVVAGPPGYVGYAPAPGVQVVAGYDDPVFYVDNGYWAYSNGGWMTWWGNSWMWAQPPIVLTTVRDPWRYRGWNPRGRGTWGTRGTRGWSGTRGGWTPPSRTTIRDHRTGRPSAPRGPIYRGGSSRGSVYRGSTPSRGSLYRGSSRGSSRGGGTVRSHRRR